MIAHAPKSASDSRFGGPLLQETQVRLIGDSCEEIRRRPIRTPKTWANSFCSTRAACLLGCGRMVTCAAHSDLELWGRAGSAVGAH